MERAKNLLGGEFIRRVGCLVDTRRSVRKEDSSSEPYIEACLVQNVVTMLTRELACGPITLIDRYP